MEIKQKVIVDMALDRGKFICQSQSMNLFLESPNISTLTSMHFYGWEKGLKTGIYYLFKSRFSSEAIQFTIEPPCENCTRKLFILIFFNFSSIINYIKSVKVFISYITIII